MDFDVKTPRISSQEAPEQQQHQHQEDPQPLLDQQQQPETQHVKDSSAVNAAPSVKETGNSLQRRNVYVSGLPETFRAAEFREMCQAFGRVEASKLCIDTKCRPMKGYGFALFFEEEAAVKCIKHLHGHWLGGRTLQARLADAAATPVPLDPSSAHPPISRARPPSKGHRHLNSSMQLTNGYADVPLPFTSSISISPSSSQEQTPPLTPPQISLTPTLVSHSDLGGGNSHNGSNNSNASVATGAQPIFYHHVPMDQQMGHPMTSFSTQPGYLSVPSTFIPSPMMGMPMYVTVPPSTNMPPGPQQQFVLPATMMASGGYPQQLYPPVVFSP
ncbi:putative RNA-binding protein [Trypanosoma cruzi]|nr:putative RNA-binding protein [Trypanosoma cruzi]